MSSGCCSENLHNSLQLAPQVFSRSMYNTVLHIHKHKHIYLLTHCHSLSPSQSLICPDLFMCCNVKCLVQWKWKAVHLARLKRKTTLIGLWIAKILNKHCNMEPAMQQPNMQGIGFGITDIWFIPTNSSPTQTQIQNLTVIHTSCLTAKEIVKGLHWV